MYKCNDCGLKMKMPLAECFYCLKNICECECSYIYSNVYYKCFNCGGNVREFIERETMFKTWIENNKLIHEDGSIALKDLKMIKRFFFEKLKDMNGKYLTIKLFTYHLKCMEAFQRCLEQK